MFKAQLREQNKCFKCFEASQLGHKCKCPTFNIIEEEEYHEVPEKLELEEIDGDATAEDADVLSVVMGRESMNTIKLIGAINKQQIIIFVDSGRTHSFLNTKLLTQMRMESEKTKPLIITIANGDKVICDSVCSKLRWQVHGESFEKDFRLLKLGRV